MNKFRLLSVAVCGMVFSLLTSCLGSSNNETSFPVYGVMDYAKNMNLVVVDDLQGSFYIPAIEQGSNYTDYSAGTCVAAFVQIKMKNPANTQAQVQASGYYTAEPTSYFLAPIKECFLNSSTTDKETILSGELPIADISGFCGFTKNRLFLPMTFNTFKAKQENIYQFSYDPTQTPEEISGERYYNLYIRAILEKEGEAPSQQNIKDVRAFNMDYFLRSAYETERALEKSHVYLKFNYIRSFNEDSTKGNWDSYKLPGIPIPKESTN